MYIYFQYLNESRKRGSQASGSRQIKLAQEQTFTKIPHLNECVTDSNLEHLASVSNNMKTIRGDQPVI